MRGLASHWPPPWRLPGGTFVTIPAEGDPGPVGVIVSKNFPEPEHVIDTLRRGIEKFPEMFFVVRETDRHTRELLTIAGLEDRVLLMPLIPCWKGERYDSRRAWRDHTIRDGCRHVLLFRKTGEKSTDEWLPQSWWQEKDWPTRLIERGSKPRKRARKGRVPVGA